MSNEYSVGDRVRFYSTGPNGQVIKKHGKIIHKFDDGRVSIDVNHPMLRTKSYPHTVHHSKIIEKV